VKPAVPSAIEIVELSLTLTERRHMGLLVTAGAVLACSFGMPLSTLSALPVNRVNAMAPAANIKDNRHFVNILHFGRYTQPLRCSGHSRGSGRSHPHALCAGDRRSMGGRTPDHPHRQPPRRG